MNKRAYIAGEIERNRIALLRMVFCWLATAFVFNGNFCRKLPRRLSDYVEDLIWAAEKSTENLLIALFYNNQGRLQLSLDYEREAMLLIANQRAVTLRHLTIGGIIQRLKSLQQILHSLHQTVRRLAKAICVKAQVEALKGSILFHGNFAPIINSALIDADNFAPP